MMGYYKCLWSWGWDFYSIRCCYYFEWNHREDNFRSHKQLLSLRSPCGSKYNFHSLVTQAARKQGQSHVTRRETKGMGCRVTKKSINRARQRLVAFVSWAISPGIGKSSQFQAHAVFPKFGLNRIYGTPWWSPAMVYVCPRYSFFFATIKVHRLPPIHVGHCGNDFCYQQQQTCSYWEGCWGQQHCNSYQDGCQFKIMVDAAQHQWYLHWCFLLMENMTVDPNTNYIYIF